MRIFKNNKFFSIALRNGPGFGLLAAALRDEQDGAEARVR